MRLGEKLTAARIRTGYDIEKFSRVCGIKASRLSSYENNMVMPKHRTIKRLSAYLHISWYYLLTDSCDIPWLGRYSQTYADLVWDKYGKRDALIFQDICIQPELMSINMDWQQKKLMYDTFFGAYCELKEKRKITERGASDERETCEKICAGKL